MEKSITFKEALKYKINSPVLYDVLSKNDTVISDIYDEYKKNGNNPKYLDLGTLPTIQNLNKISSLIDNLDNERIINHKAFDKDLYFQEFEDVYFSFSSSIRQIIFDVLSDTNYLDVLAEIAVDKKYDTEISNLLKTQLSTYISTKDKKTKNNAITADEKIKELPPELYNDTFKGILERAISEKIIDDNLNRIVETTTLPEFSCFIKRINEELNLVVSRKNDKGMYVTAYSWKPFEKLFNVKNMAQVSETNKVRKDFIDRIVTG